MPYQVQPTQSQRQYREINAAINMKNNPNQKNINRPIIPKDVFSY
jgi:hypothetical protein